MILKRKATIVVPSKTQIVINTKGKELFKDEPWVNCIGLIMEVSRRGDSARIIFPGVKETKTTINKRYLELRNGNHQ